MTGVYVKPHYSKSGKLIKGYYRKDAKKKRKVRKRTPTFKQSWSSFARSKKGKKMRSR